METRQPVEITKYSFVQNSGGPGRNRGGAALQRGYRLLADEAKLIMRSDRRKVTPYGLSDGLPGTPSWNIINHGTEQKILPVCPMASVPMVKGDEFIHIQAGAGGFGDPLEREPEKILIDVQNELITPAYANDVYGVVIIEGEIDLGATEAKRLELKQTGTLEKAYLTHFYDEIGIKPV
jgi:N-methylhydantoinase B